jgi:hypothetical protein
MIRHCVFLNLIASYDADELRSTFDELNKLCLRLEGASDFRAGPNRDFEGKSQGFDHGFTIDFTDKPALQTYAEHPEHVALGARLVAQCENGAAGIVVFDLECAQA